MPEKNQGQIQVGALWLGNDKTNIIDNKVFFVIFSK